VGLTEISQISSLKVDSLSPSKEERERGHPKRISLDGGEPNSAEYFPGLKRMEGVKRQKGMPMGGGEVFSYPRLNRKPKIVIEMTARANGALDG